MSILEIIPSLIGYLMCILAIIHAIKASDNLLQRLVMLFSLFLYGFLLELMGVISGNYDYAEELIMLLGIIPLSVTLAWVGIIYSVMVIAESLNLTAWQRIIMATLIALSLDWGMDPIAVDLGAWTWNFEGGSYFGIPSFNFIGWFFIPIAYLTSYGIFWDRQNKHLKLLTIKEVEERDSIGRKLYSVLGVVPISMGILLLVGIVTRIPFLYNLPLIIVIIWVVLTVVIATVVISWKYKSLKLTKWFDIIPSIILMVIEINYTIYGFLAGRFDLAIIMILTGIPLWLIFIFTLVNNRTLK